MKEGSHDRRKVDKGGALTPGQAIKGLLDYDGVKQHYYLYKSATAKLKEELFDCEPDSFFQFMKSLGERAGACGWSDPETGILWVPPRRHEDPINFLESYGIISLGRIQRHEMTYWDSGSRASQDDRMLYE